MFVGLQDGLEARMAGMQDWSSGDTEPGTTRDVVVPVEMLYRLSSGRTMRVHTAADAPRSCLLSRKMSTSFNCFTTTPEPFFVSKPRNWVDTQRPHKKVLLVFIALTASFLTLLHTSRILSTKTCHLRK
ncbi:MAG: hypothetical protein CL912_06720 [Deltaproteobacteria bacterium]|nr:hypothetical protein [Deltaproteobacteria bacterium]